METVASKLLVDIGNTRLKWGLSNGLDIMPGETVLNAGTDKAALAQLWRNIPRPGVVAIACVGSLDLAQLVLNIANELWPSVKINFATAQAENFGVKNAYKNPELLGVDRWLGMIAAYHRYQTALCLVGCGTAVTVDVIDAGGQHLGGLICPGLRLMRTALTQNTQQLSLIDEVEFSKGLADCTAAAIHNGALMAVCGMIEEVLGNQSSNLKLVLTGGDAPLIAFGLTRQAVVEPNLVLKGLALTVKVPV